MTMVTKRSGRLCLGVLLLALAPACGQEEAADRAAAPQRFVADLAPLNESGVDGTARMALAADHLTVDIEARGLERAIHGQYVHGRRGERGREASCPVPADDTDADGFVGIEEGERAYGRALLALEPFPTVGRSGRLDWDLTVNVDPRRIRPLDRGVVLLRGRSADLDRRGGDEYVPDLPVACGRIEPVGAVAREGGAG